jgi:glucokinase
LSVHNQIELFAGVDLGGTFVKIGLFDKQLNILGRKSISTNPDKGPAYMVRQIVKIIRELSLDNGFDISMLRGVGLAAPGPVDIAQGVIKATPNLPLYNRFPICEELSNSLGVDVVFEKDANAAAWGEFVAGESKDLSEIALITLGTGIGGAIISDAQIIHGSDERAGEFGHIIIIPNGRKCCCTQNGCAEAYASTRGILERVQEDLANGVVSSLREVANITCKDVYDQAKAGDAYAVELTEVTAEVLGLLCVNIYSYSNPQKIIFAGGLIAAGDFLLDRIKYYFNRHMRKDIVVKTKICFTSLAGDAGITGCASLAINKFKSRHVRSYVS